ncbi:MAG: UDP-N-acetylmuramate dehydrogenase [Gammaproteobacteria bacterium]
MQNYSGQLEEQVKLARYCTWRVGGFAQYVYSAVDRDDLIQFITNPAYAPFTWLGLGSNVLIRDGGIEGTVILTQDCLSELHQIDDQKVYVEAGVPCAKLAKLCARLGFCGAEFFGGIPGTMGGALFMNAGAYGSETWQYVVEVETLDANGNIHVRKPEDFKIAYRHIEGPPEWFISATLQFTPGDSQITQANLKELLQKRNAAQPIGLPSGGSVFRNPPGNYAARLIEAAGLKGYAIGGAQVSPKHANFIVNTGNALAADIENLILYLRERVQESSGILLEPEVKILGILSRKNL